MVEDIRNSQVSPPSWSSVEYKVITEIVRQGEIHLASQLTSACTADQRASSMLSMTVAATTTTLGGGLALLLSTTPNYILGFGGLSSGACLMISSWLLLQATKPTSFHFTGNWPRNWFGRHEVTKMIKVSLGETAENYDEMIEYNDNVLRTNAKLVKYATRAIFAAPLIGFCTAVLVWLKPIF
jgi:hypothetical protein